MEELLKDFLTESSEQLEAVGAQLARFERAPSDARIIADIFRLVHAIKGACGFLNLGRLERIAYFAETLIVRLREGGAPNADAVTLVLAAVGRIKFILRVVAEGHGEPTGDDDQLIAQLKRAAERSPAAPDSLREVARGAAPTFPERRTDTVRISF